MGRKPCFSSLFFYGIRGTPKSTSSSFSSSFPWAWPPCKFPKTKSFRRTASAGDDIFKTLNSIYFDPPNSLLEFSDDEMEGFSICNSIEKVMRRRLRSDRFFFEPGEASASIMKEAKSDGGGLFRQSIAIAVDSEDPCRDFRASMEEVVAANGIKDWEKLFELFVWFLKANEKEMHGSIIAAFLELLGNLAATPPSFSSGFSFEIDAMEGERHLR